MKAKYLSSLIGSGLGACLLLVASLANASTTITFSVDMTAQVQAGTFVPGTDNVSVHGTFNGWGTGMTLTNTPVGDDTNVYSGTLVDTVEANPSLTMYKFVNSHPGFPNGGYESTGDNGNNRMYVLPSTTGQSVVLPTVFFSDQGVAVGDGVTNEVTFQVDMAQQIATGAFNTNADTVEVHGLFNGWAAGTLTADPTILRTNSFGLVTSNVYTGTFNTVAFSPGENADYKFVIGPAENYESLNGQLRNENPNNNFNRFFTVSSTNNASLTNPVVFFSDAPYAPISTNNVLFQVDMTTEIERGRFNPSVDVLEVQGSFTGWGTSPLIMSPNLSGSNTNIYTNSFTFVQGVGSTEQQYKYVNSDIHEPNGGYDQPAPNGQNRYYTQLGGTNVNVIVPPVYFSDIAPMNWVPVTNNITFTVDMTGAVESGSGNAFDPTTDQVYINGDFIYVNNAPWANGAWDIGTLANYQMTNNPIGSSNYSITLGIPETPGAGNVQVNYNYGIFDGTNADNVANEGTGNHTRWIRNLPAGGYTFPTDKFGVNVSEGTAFNVLSSVSPSWVAPHGTVPIAWLGLPNVHLQASTNPAGPTWINLPATDGTNWTTGYQSPNGFVSVTNWPFSNPQHYFRLVQPYIAP